MGNSIKVGLYCHAPETDLRRFERCLNHWGFPYDILHREEFSDLPDKGFDTLLLHGGWYGIDRTPGQNREDFTQNAEQLKRGEILKNYVKDGSGLIGICAGSYNVIWMDFIKAEVSRMDGVGMHSMEVVQSGHPVLRDNVFCTENRSDRLYKNIPVVRFNGPMFFPEEKDSLVLSYDWEQRIGAVLADTFGRGRAAAISPHPERTENDLEDASDPLDEPLMPVADVLKNAILWTAGKID
ncbi:MAG: hypothetical protein ACYTFY_09425 [Planctomycetota bacterium]